MEHLTKHVTSSAIFLLILHMATAKPAKLNASPVYEVINEQARIDQDIRPPTGILPYGNPLAGNSQKNARLHAQNQQAMFNAEKIRQHRAQLQRWAQLSHVDSYMQAYRDSQENHQLAVESQQALDIAVPREKKPVRAETKQRRHPNPKPENLKKGVRVIPDVVKITKADAISKTERNRNHRSYGSVEYQQYLQPQMYKTVYVSPAPTYDQGVTIKPNGNIGLSGQHIQEGPKLFTEAVPSKTQYQYVYPKQYSQMQGYESAQEIASLNSLLQKNPHEQLSELNALINLSKGTGERNKDELETPIDLYFYMKDPPAQNVLQPYDQALYKQEEPQTYASAYTPDPKDHTPITEEVDDVDDPNKHTELNTYSVQTVLATPAPELEQIETTTTKSNNYYKVEVASQTISSGSLPKSRYQYYVKGHEDDTRALEYIQPSTQYVKHEDTEGDESERYLHHNAVHKGVQHLTEDGTGVSAYKDDNLHYAASYEFGYRVRDRHSGNDFGHHEVKSEGHTNGHYHVLLPDGRMQKVKYSAGPGGFHADISYDHLH